jgi:hypothetical protein
LNNFGPGLSWALNPPADAKPQKQGRPVLFSYKALGGISFLLYYSTKLIACAAVRRLAAVKRRLNEMSSLTSLYKKNTLALLKKCLYVLMNTPYKPNMD